MNQSSRLKVRDELAYRQLAHQMVIVDPQGGVLHTLNHVGCFAWQQIEAGNDTMEGLVQAITTEFEVEPHQASADLQSFVDELMHKKLLLER